MTPQTEVVLHNTDERGMNGLIRFSLDHRLLVLAVSLLVLVGGGYAATTLPIDIFPSLTRPRASR